MDCSPPPLPSATLEPPSSDSRAHHSQPADDPRAGLRVGGVGVGGFAISSPPSSAALPTNGTGIGRAAAAFSDGSDEDGTPFHVHSHPAAYSAKRSAVGVGGSGAHSNAASRRGGDEALAPMVPRAEAANSNVVSTSFGGGAALAVHQQQQQQQQRHSLQQSSRPLTVSPAAAQEVLGMLHATAATATLPKHVGNTAAGNAAVGGGNSNSGVALSQAPFPHVSSSVIIGNSQNNSLFSSAGGGGGGVSDGNNGFGSSAARGAFPYNSPHSAVGSELTVDHAREFYRREVLRSTVVVLFIAAVCLFVVPIIGIMLLPVGAAVVYWLKDGNRFANGGDPTACFNRNSSLNFYIILLCATIFVCGVDIFFLVYGMATEGSATTSAALTGSGGSPPPPQPRSRSRGQYATVPPLATAASASGHGHSHADNRGLFFAELAVNAVCGIVASYALYAAKRLQRALES